MLSLNLLPRTIVRSPILALLVFALGTAPSAYAASFVVSNLNDSGVGSLRQAITDTSGSGDATDIITFSVSGTIAPSTALQSLTKGGTTIDGGGNISLDGNLFSSAQSGISLLSSDNVIKDLTVIRFSATALTITGDSNSIVGCFVGTDVNSTSGLGNEGWGVIVSGTSNIIGGDTAAERNVISGNGETGIRLGDFASNNSIIGNYIGTDVGGTTALGNAKDGVEVIFNASANNIGDGTPGGRNIISGNRYGVILNGNSNNSVLGNYIGTDVTGVADLGNTVDGIYILGGATLNNIGDGTSGGRNVISGNEFAGVSITGSSNNTVLGNFIGTNASGTAALGNSNWGVNISLSQSNAIGDGTIGGRNIISGNGGAGIQFTSAQNNSVLGNYIGTDVNGTTALGNASYGIRILQGAISNSIGNGIAGGGNLISGNSVDGIRINGNGTGASSNTVLGNYIGTDATGTAKLGNAANGVLIFNGATSNNIGNGIAGGRNIISGNGGDGVQINGIGASSTGNSVLGNYIGTDVTGTVKLGNASSGIYILAGASSNNIGDGTPGGRNIISGNGLQGVWMVSSGTSNNTLLGNFIGTDVNGTAALGNSTWGVVISQGAQSNNIGNGQAGGRNVISGNGIDGILLVSSASNISILGNYIGTDVSGTIDLGNADNGVNVFSGATSNNIGNGTAEGRNVISGNGGDGIQIDGDGVTGASSNTVLGNYVGTDATGTAKLGNASSGIGIVSGATFNTIGDGTAEGRNIISGNTGNGVSVSGLGTSSNSVIGNYIGTDFTGMVDLGNVFDGVEIIERATLNTIGNGTAVGSNLISGNGGDGVQIDGSLTLNNTISLNSIFGNDGSGINLTLSANNNIAPPSITDLGSVIGTALANSTVEIFVDDVNQGEGYLDTVIADASGNFTSAVNLSAHSGRFITATATDGTGNTSEFSAAVAVPPLNPPVITVIPPNPTAVECGDTYTDAHATASDIEDGDLTSSIVVVNPVDTTTPGPYIVTYNVTDSSGTPAEEMTRSVTVVDTTPPIITLTGGDPPPVECGDAYVDQGAMAIDICDGDLTGAIVVDNPVDTQVPGIYIVRYNVSDNAGNAAVGATRTVTVVDTTPPIITLIGLPSVTLECGSMFTDPGATAFDTCDGALVVPLPPFDTQTPGMYLLLYNVSDNAGNEAIEVTRMVTVVDTLPPVITPIGDDPETVEKGNIYTDDGANALDLCEGDLSASIIVTNPVNTSLAGEYTVRYNVSDGEGNVAIEATRIVNVVDTVRPTVTIDQDMEQSDPTNGLPILFEVEFSEDVTGFDSADVSLTPANIGMPMVGGSGSSYIVMVTGVPDNMDLPVTISATISENVAIDLSGNSNEASTSTDNSVVYDTMRPTVTIEQSVTQADPSNELPILFDVVFSEEVTGFTEGDVSFSDPNIGLPAISGSGATYTVIVSDVPDNPASPTTVTASIIADMVLDLAGNSNFISTSVDNTVVYDTSRPSIVIGAPVPAATCTETIDFIVTYSGADSITLQTADVTVNSAPGLMVGDLPAVTGSGNFQRTVTLSNFTGAGTVSITIAEGTAVSAAGVLAAAAGPSPEAMVCIPTIGVDPASLSYTAPGGDMSLNVFNAGQGTLSWIATYSSWLSVVPSSGTGDEIVVTVTADLNTGMPREGSIRFSSPGASNSPLDVPVNQASTVDPVILVDPDPLIFDEIPANTTTMLSVNVMNVGGRTLSGEVSTELPFSIVGNAGYSLASMETTTIMVEFAPLKLGFYKEDLVFKGDDDQIVSDDVDVSVEGGREQLPGISVTPLAGDFGSVRAPGETSYVKFRVQNTGGGVASGEADVSPDFKIVSGADYDVESGDFHEIIVGFSPQEEARAGGIMTLSLGSAMEVVVTAPLSGVGRAVLGSIRGRVVDPSGLIIPCAAITARATIPGVAGGVETIFRVVATRSDGTFSIEDLPGATYELEVFASDLLGFVEDVIVSDGMETEFDFELRERVEGQFVAGRVTDVNTGFPLAGIEVAIDENNDMEIERTVYTCADGFYAAFLSGSKSPVRVIISASNYEIYDPIIDTTEPDLVVDASLVPITVKFGSLEGVILNINDNEPIVLAEIEATQDNDTWPATSDPDGRFEITGLGPGQYEVHISAEGYMDKSRLVTVFEESAENQAESFDLTPLGQSSLEAFPTRIVPGTRAGQFPFSVYTTVPFGEADVEWTATVSLGDDSWLTLNPETGEGDDTIDVMYTDNGTRAERTATVTIASTTGGVAGSPVTIEITQASLDSGLSGLCGAYSLPGPSTGTNGAALGDLLALGTTLVLLIVFSKRRRVNPADVVFITK